MTAPVSTTDARPQTRASSVNTRVLGGLLLVFGSGWMLKQAGIVDLPWAAVASIVLIGLGLALVITSRSRVRTVPLVLLGAALTVGLAIGSSNIGIRGGFGERIVRPTELSRSVRYELAFGELQVDLRSTVLQNDITTVRASVSGGRLLVRVPKGVEVQVDVDARFGSATVLGKRLDIHGNASDTVTTENYDTAERKLHLILHAGFGQIDVTQ